MTPKNHLKRSTPSLSLLTLVLVGLAFAPQMHAVSPAPDGCYPGFTTAEGCNALSSLTSGAGNTAVGWYSLFLDISGSYNTGLGAGTLALNNSNSNTAVGAGAMLLNTVGGQNVAVGSNALLYNDSGNNNNAVGFSALASNTTGGQNQAMGLSALGSNATGAGNIAIGDGALVSNVAGNFNTVMGWRAGLSVEGSDNIYIGDSAGFGIAAESFTTRIGNEAFVTSCYIAGIFDNPQPYGAGFDTVAINLATGQLARYHDSAPSSRRYKEDIKPIDDASEAIFSLKPVTFRYKKEIDPTGVSQFGLVAEDVEKVNPALVERGEDGKVFTVRYESVNAMLLNEFLKEHRKVQDQERRIQEQEVTIVQLKKQIETLVAHVKEHDSKIQKVSDQIEMNKAAVQLVSSNR